MRRRLVLVALLVIPVASLAPLAAQATASPLGSVRAIRHGLSIQPPHHKAAHGKVKQKLYSAYHLATKGSQLASLSFKDGSTLDINQNTDLILTSPHVTHIKSGEVDVIENGAHHQVVTAVATVSAIGTEDDVRVINGADGKVTAVITVVQGTVMVTSSKASRRVTPAHQVTVSPSGAISPPVAVDAAAVVAWTSGLPAPAQPSPTPTTTTTPRARTSADQIGQITPSGKITEFPIPTGGSGTYDIAAGPDGNVWFTEAYANQIGRITPNGKVTEFPIPTDNSDPQGITAGPDGNVWFTELSRSRIGRITPSGKITEFRTAAISSPVDITPGPGGDLWFTDGETSKIGRITPSGKITEFPIPTAGGQPSYITAGPDGNLWFTQTTSYQIGRMTPSGTITEFPAPVYPRGITAGPNGDLWFTDLPGIGQITPSGTMTEFPLANIAVRDITAGPDGNLWFTGTFGIGQMTPSGTIAFFPIDLATGYRELRDITAGPDGNLWFTEEA